MLITERKGGYQGGALKQARKRRKIMPTTLEIIRGIAQAAANAYDGSHLEALSADGDIREDRT
jgi:hypothetical protein